MFAIRVAHTNTKNVTLVGCLHTATWDRSCPYRHRHVARPVRVDAATQPARWASETSSPTHGHANGSAHPAVGATMCPPVFTLLDPVFDKCFSGVCVNAYGSPHAHCSEKTCAKHIYAWSTFPEFHTINLLSYYLGEGPQKCPHSV